MRSIHGITIQRRFRAWNWEERKYNLEQTPGQTKCPQYQTKLIPDDKIGDPEYLAAFHHLIMPIAHEFNPDLVPPLVTLLTAGLRISRIRRSRRPFKWTRRPPGYTRGLRNDDPSNNPISPWSSNPRIRRRLRTCPTSKLCNSLSRSIVNCFSAESTGYGGHIEEFKTVCYCTRVSFTSLGGAKGLLEVFEGGGKSFGLRVEYA